MRVVGTGDANDASIEVSQVPYVAVEPDWKALEIAGLQRSIEKLQVQMDGAKDALARAIAQQEEN